MKKMLFSILSVLLVSLLFSPSAFSQDTVVRITPASVVSPAVGERFTINVAIENGQNVAGYQVMVLYDPTALEAVAFNQGDYLSEDAFFGGAWLRTLTPQKRVRFAATSSPSEINGDGILGTLTFEVLALKTSSLTLVVGNSSTNSGTLLSNKNGTVSFPRVENALVVDTAATPTTYRSNLVPPPDLISEVAFGPNSTYFVLNAQFPTLAGVSDPDVIYKDCVITLDLPGVPTEPVGESDNNDRRLDNPDYFMYLLETPRQRLEAVGAETGANTTISVATSLVGGSAWRSSRINNSRSRHHCRRGCRHVGR